jgi:hypothetical protein
LVVCRHLLSTNKGSIAAHCASLSQNVSAISPSPPIELESETRASWQWVQNLKRGKSTIACIRFCVNTAVIISPDLIRSFRTRFYKHGAPHEIPDADHPNRNRLCYSGYARRLRLRARTCARSVQTATAPHYCAKAAAAADHRRGTAAAAARTSLFGVGAGTLDLERL